MKRFFLFCSGANISVLKGCPTDESKYVGIGATIALTAVLASLSGGYALFTVFWSIPVAAGFGILWGIMIFNLDRVIVSGMRKQKHFALDLLYAAPRFAISILLAVVISRPLELKLFEVEIQDRWAQMQMDDRRGDVARILAQDSARLNELARVGAQLNAEVEVKRREFNQRQNDWITEKEGTAGTGIPGAGDVYRQKERAMNEAERQLNEVKARNIPLIGRNDRETTQLRDQQERRIERADSVRTNANGFLARMEAFGVLKDESRTTHWASVFITLLFVSLETAPVMVKLLSTLSPYRPYDELLEQQEFEVVEAARQKVRLRKREMKDQDESVAAEFRLSTKRNQMRLDAELRANEDLMDRIADAQVELAEHLVEAWKQHEREKIDNDLGAYVQSSP